MKTIETTLTDTSDLVHAALQTLITELIPPTVGKPRYYTTNCDFAVEFSDKEGLRSGISLYVDARPDGSYKESEVRDADGNDFTALKIRATVTWPSWGSDGPKVCQERLAIMTLATRIAAEIEAKFATPFYSLIQTAAEREVNEAKRTQRAKINKIERLMENNLKGMRVGTERRIEANSEEDFENPETSIEFTTSGKAYKMTAFGTKAIYFTRTA